MSRRDAWSIESHLNALQDRVHSDPGKLVRAVPIKRGRWKVGEVRYFQWYPPHKPFPDNARDTGARSHWTGLIELVDVPNEIEEAK